MPIGAGEVLGLTGVQNNAFSKGVSVFHWSSNGLKKAKGSFKNGIGVNTIWDEQGNIEKIEYWERDELIRTEKPNAEPANPADREGAAADL